MTPHEHLVCVCVCVLIFLIFLNYMNLATLYSWVVCVAFHFLTFIYLFEYFSIAHYRENSRHSVIHNWITTLGITRVTVGFFICIFFFFYLSAIRTGDPSAEGWPCWHLQMFCLELGWWWLQKHCGYCQLWVNAFQIYCLWSVIVLHLQHICQHTQYKENFYVPCGTPPSCLPLPPTPIT
jgi:amino acid transporter